MMCTLLFSAYHFGQHSNQIYLDKIECVCIQYAANAVTGVEEQQQQQNRLNRKYRCEYLYFHSSLVHLVCKTVFAIHLFIFARKKKIPK